MKDKKPKEVEKKELKKFMRVSADDAKVIEKVEEVDLEVEVLRLKQVVIDADAEIARREGNKAEALAELAKYDK